MVEAALFSAGRALSEEEIAFNAGLSPHVVREALPKLVEVYRSREGALEITKAGEKWIMTVRPRYVRAAEKLAPREIPERTLRTLALIAYHQPILQSELVRRVGPKAYDHVSELLDLGLIYKRIHERSFLLGTTPKFPEYFGIPSTRREEIRNFLSRKLGLETTSADS